jgi:LysR family transcriptional activator of dmlA
VINQSPSNEDLRVFTAVVLKSGFAAAARDLGASPAYVSKRVRVLEQQLGAPLLHRTTRHVALTEEGERAYRWARRILDDVDQLLQEVGGARTQAVGTLRVSSSFGFGRLQVAPALGALTERHPGLQVRLELVDRLVDVAAEGFDLDVRVGDEIAPHLIARRLADNHRVLCAAPRYVERRGLPRTLDDLRAHDCLAIKERDHPFGVWRLRSDGREQSVKVSGPLSSNNGEVALRWALDGRGIVLRSMWQVAALLAEGTLVQVLPAFTQPANVWAVYPSRLERSSKLRVAVEFLVQWFQPGAPPARAAAHRPRKRRPAGAAP